MDTKKESKLVYVKYLFFLFLFFLLSSIPDIVMAILIGLDFSDWLIMVIILGLNGLIIRFVYKKYLAKPKIILLKMKILKNLSGRKFYLS